MQSSLLPWLLELHSLELVRQDLNHAFIKDKIIIKCDLAVIVDDVEVSLRVVVHDY